MMPLKLIVEKPEEEFEYILSESKEGSKSLYIKGPYMMAEGYNRNKRMYKLDEMVKEVARYKRDMIETNRALGTLNHESSADVDLERACHIVTEMWQDGNVFYGKSKVLSTPSGLVVKCLINDGVKVGMSSRALGQLQESAEGSVVSDLRLISIDCVADPSFPKAFVNGILESKQWVLNDHGVYEENYDIFENKLKKLPKKELNEYLMGNVMDFIKKLK